ncbi:MAG: recombinase family protein [Desulfovibrio sp.]|nr:recombinase family protein [Desulfovibrio sp.]
MHVLYLKTNANSPAVPPLLLSRAFDALYTDNQHSTEGRSACLENLKAGDTLYVERESCMGESLPEVISVFRTLAERGVHVWIDAKQKLIPSSESPYLKLTALLGQALQHFKRDFFKTRSEEGRERAKAKGQILGRKKNALPSNFEEMKKAYQEGTISGPVAAKACNMPVTTFYRRCKEV